MSVNFLHGVETIRVSKGPRPVSQVKTAVIGLVGMSPKGPTNQCVLVKNPNDAAQFGSQINGFDIPQTLEHIFDQNAGTVVVVNIFDPAIHTSAVVAEPQTVTGGKLKLAFAPIGAITVLKADGTASDYIAGTDYSIDDFGNLLVIAGRIPENTVMKFTYKKLNSAAVLSAHVVGTVDGNGNKTGLKALDLAFSLFGFRPKIIVVPGKSAIKAIATEMQASAERLRAVALIDSTFGDTVAQAIASRGDATKAFGSSSSRLIALYPYLKAYDVNKDDGNPATDTNTNFPFSGFYAGVMAANDNANGYWYSPSNKEIKGCTGLERPISANLNDASTDANALNEVGIATVFNSFGTGFRTWGNRNLSFPTSTDQDNFIAVLRTFDVIHESLELAAIEFADKPITKALVDDIRQSGNNFIKVLIGRGAIAEGSKVLYNPADNSVENLAAGKLVFRIIKAGNSPAERITYLSEIDLSLLATIK
jgi:phage tail sheath protein FI